MQLKSIPQKTQSHNHPTHFIKHTNSHTLSYALTAQLRSPKILSNTLHILYKSDTHHYAIPLPGVSYRLKKNGVRDNDVQRMTFNAVVVAKKREMVVVGHLADWRPI